MASSNDGVWRARTRDLLKEQRQALVDARRRIDLAKGQAQALLNGLNVTTESWARKLGEFDERLNKLQQWEHDPVVLVRTSAGGYAPPPYHSAENPCGRVRHGRRFRQLLLGEAESEGLQPCSACAGSLKGLREA